ncbi:MAG: hypothetical protein QOE99_2779 [Actinomycetota bacterium]|jgi:hypothetical protein|nr:hypothetical protein [Actinomycetota bacterium]
MALRISIVRTESPDAPNRRRRWTVAAATAAVVVLMSGVSYAWWSATGTGSAAVGSINAQIVTVTSSSPVISDLYPGKVDPLSFVLTNPNPYNVKVVTLTLTSYASNNESTCPAAANLAVLNGPFTLNVQVNANSTANASIANMVTMNTGALDACQGKTFTFNFTLSGTQV